MVIILLLLLIFLLCQNNIYGGHKLGIDPEPKIGDLITIENDDINVYFKKIINYKIMPKELLTQLYKEIGINDYRDEIKDKEKYINAIEKFYKTHPEYILRLDYLNNLLLSRHVGKTIKYKKMYEIESLDPVKFLTPLLSEYGYDKTMLDKFKDKTKTGLYDAKVRLENIKNVGFFEFDTKDIVRNPIIGEILKRYD